MKIEIYGKYIWARLVVEFVVKMEDWDKVRVVEERNRELLEINKGDRHKLQIGAYLTYQ